MEDFVGGPALVLNLQLLKKNPNSNLHAHPPMQGSAAGPQEKIK